ncbi:hypothetical protein TWF718_005152 [Orbilia javanica]|uniref:EthD domain-containing protein n=1 Tax=Orbilia javanica TaxID=47235 RepID=A0AAN8N6W1_9PEZI
MDTEKFIRITLYVQKKPGMTDEKFNEYWAHIHGPLCLEWMKKYGIVKCAQKHINKTGTQFLKETLPFLPLSSVDGIEDFYVRDIKDFTDAFADEEYKKLLAPDAGEFIDAPNMFVSVGEDYVLIENGDIKKQHQRSYHCV